MMSFEIETQSNAYFTNIFRAVNFKRDREGQQILGGQSLPKISSASFIYLGVNKKQKTYKELRERDLTNVLSSNQNGNQKIPLLCVFYCFDR